MNDYSTKKSKMASAPPAPSTPPLRAGRGAGRGRTARAAALGFAMCPDAAVPAAAIDPPSPATAQLAAQVRQMEHTCSALNERLATLHTAERSPQRDAQEWERERLERERVERERVERELQRRDLALVHATCAAAKASGLAEHYKSQTDELRRRYAQLQARVRDESRRGAATDHCYAEAGASGTQFSHCTVRNFHTCSPMRQFRRFPVNRSDPARHSILSSHRLCLLCQSSPHLVHLQPRLWAGGMR
jgi:hypothetical protein